MGVSSRCGTGEYRLVMGWGKSVAGGVVVWAHCWVLRERAPRVGGVTLVANDCGWAVITSNGFSRVVRVWLWYAVVMVVGPSVL